ncbi:MAG: glycerol-3-phosphate dehydrogenase/oxidase [bacterium]
MKPETALDFSDRTGCFTALAGETFDVLVIGAGITGCGIARDAAMRGLRTALIDAGDIGSGTSSRSSKLIHGGLRYLAQGQMGVVREAANERRILRQLAPHLSLTNPMVVLAHSRRALFMLRTALWTYEKMGRVDKEEHHEVWDAAALLSEEPVVRAGDVRGAVIYPEYLTDDSRLTLGNARSAAAHDAVVVSRARAEQFIMENGRVSGAVVAGTLPSEDRRVSVRARVVVNASGPWVDVVRRLEDPSVPARLQLTKGIHLVFKKQRLPLHRTVVWNAPDGRGLFAVPRGGYIYIGTTDTFYENPAYWPEITPVDIAYLMDSANTVFSGEPLTTADVVALWSGLRPLLGSEGKKPSEISRRDEVMEGVGGVLSIAGGKLTSYRSMAARLVDVCEQKLNRKPSPATTADEPLPGGDFDEPFATLCARVQQLGMTSGEAERLTRLYGSEALEIFQSGWGPAVEADHAVKYEGALTLRDYWVRRSSRAFFDENGGLDSLEPASRVMAAHLGWSESERLGQIGGCYNLRAIDLAVLEKKDR